MLKCIMQTFIVNRLHIIVSVPAVMLCWSGFLNVRFRSIDYLIITLAVACICQWNRLTDVEEDTLNCPDDLKNAQTKSRAIKVFCYTSGTIAILLAFFTEPTWKIAGLIAFGATTGYFYNTPLWHSKPNLRLKNMFIIKNLSSGAGWSAGLLIFPMMRTHTQPDRLFFTAFVYMFAMIMTYEIMWDIRDVEGDTRARIRTLPIVLGINSARIYTVILQFVCLGIIISGLANAVLTPVWSLHLFPSVMLLTLIIFFPRLIRFNRGLSHVLVLAISIYAYLSGFLSTRFG
jgi:4-hydroxybenzoate polyprenyltransferase